MTKCILPFCVAILFSPMAIAGGKLVDPTKPPDTIVAKPRENLSVTVDMVIFSPNKRLAFINGQWLKEGQSFSGMTILKINKNNVLISRGKRQKEYISFNRVGIKPHAVKKS
ncbi:MAG: hypothetical protein DHS20C10_10260 [marine bacterium B5-7]|nr:MAG: hypothetical protein DHS20C10_10260 [marine bacterium B5-7]